MSTDRIRERGISLSPISRVPPLHQTLIDDGQIPRSLPPLLPPPPPRRRRRGGGGAGVVRGGGAVPGGGGGGAAAAVFVVFPPREPTIAVAAIRLPGYAAANGTARFTFAQYAAVRNPNRAAFSHYDSSIRLVYAGGRRQAGFMFIPAGLIPAGRTQYMAASFAVDALPLPLPPPPRRRRRRRSSRWSRGCGSRAGSPCCASSPTTSRPSPPAASASPPPTAPSSASAADARFQIQLFESFSRKI
uniref:Late embryogenesis abundant protein LEA-2 subgroup domain-containing protein n=1 Tax=Ananas comosus var. bracteatus TaxID=296719 RepID=A0A6V7QL14_ANACO|nr:unnamed protein product [Ananas comosus var. bracteatus]